MYAYLKILRPLNLLIVGLTQYIVYMVLIKNHSSITSLSTLQNMLLACCTMMVTAGGYIINDIYDRDLDKINKPNKVIVGQAISLSQSYTYYWILVVLGFAVAIWLGVVTQNIPHIVLYVIGTAVLYFYASHFKKKGYLGNIIVALMTAFVPGLIWLAERKYINSNEGFNIKILLLFFMAFAFLSNLAREVIKDVEDMDGDKIIDSKSLPLTLGLEKTKIIIFFNLSILILIIWALALVFKNSLVYSGNGLLSIFIIIILYEVNNTHHAKEFHHISNWMKYLMLTGVVYLLLLSKFAI
jgi:4-hydroxybenzoate polyprenyltransferase